MTVTVTLDPHTDTESDTVMPATQPAPSRSIVYGPARTRVELRHRTWGSTVTGAPPVELPPTRPDERHRSFQPDDITVSSLQVEDDANPHTSHGWRVHEIQLTGLWLPDPHAERVIEATQRGTLRIQGLRAAPDWAQAHAVANVPTATLLPATTADPGDDMNADASSTSGFVARTGIGVGTATDHDGVHITAPKCYTEAIHLVTIPQIRGADPIPASKTTSIDPRILGIQHAWRTQTDDTDWKLDQITVTGTLHADPPTDTPGPTLLLGRDQAHDWMLALAVAKAPSTVLRFGTDSGIY